MPGRYFPSDLVSFVAKTGFITKETWGEYFFQGGSVRWRNFSWTSLKQRGYFLPHRSQLIKDIYLLDRMNREVAGFVKGRAVRAPILSQIDHDEVLVRGLLRAVRNGLVSGWTAEAELKSFARDSFRIESQGQTVKYPDAILDMSGPGAATKIALEIELTQKCRQRYIQILGAYASMSRIAGVLFVTDSMAIRQMIKDVARQVYFPFEKVMLEFLSVKDWLNAAWCAQLPRLSGYST
jgi:hypothetical protein